MTARRAASLVLFAAAAAQYSAEQRQEFERTRQELLARDPLAAQLRDEHLHGRLPRKPGDLHHRWGRDSRSGSISRHTQHQFMWYVADTYGPKLPYAAVLGHVVGMDTRFFSDEEIHRVHELPHWKDLDNLHHKVSYHLSTKLVARKPPSN